MISSGVCFIISGDVQCVERDLKPASSLCYTADDLLHVAMIATNVNRQICLKNWRIPKTTNIAEFTIPNFSPLSDSIFYCYGCTKLETPVTVRTLCRETIQGLDVDAVATNTVKSRKWRNGASSRCFWGQQIVFTYRTEDLSNSKFSINYEIDYFFCCRTDCYTAVLRPLKS